MESLNRASFYEIGKRTGTDKCTHHQYHFCYEAHFEMFREAPISLLEIGVSSGASLRLWEEYFPSARIFGIDCEPSCSKYASDRSRIFIGNQEDPEFLKYVAAQTGALDVVIDDGSHMMKAQQISFRELFPFVKIGGFYVIEDLETSYHTGYSGGPVGTSGTMIEMLKQLLDDVYVSYHHEPIKAPKPISEMHFYKNIAFLVRGKD